MMQNSSLIGSTLGNQYQILDLLGQGAMGAVFRAHDLENEMDVAVKVISLSAQNAGIQRSEFEGRFEREIKIAMRLHHDHIVRTLNHGRDPVRNTRFVVMELLKGRPLDQVLRAQPEGRMSTVQAAEIGRQIADALEYAHSPGQELVHRDIKPANIFLCEDARGRTQVKVMDFGGARVIHADENAEGRRRKWTLPGQVLGTFQYMAPEQWLGQADPRSDVYALGIMLYLMVEGRYPSKEQSGPPAFWAAYHNLEAPAEMTVCRSARMVDVILDMLIKNPQQRPTAAKVQDELERVLAELGGPGRITPPEGSISPSLVRPSAEPSRPTTSRPDTPTVQAPIQRAGAGEATVIALGDSALLDPDALPEGIPTPVYDDVTLTPATAPTRLSSRHNLPTRPMGVKIIPPRIAPTPPPQSSRPSEAPRKSRRWRWWPFGKTS